ncbi:hypothetical protein RFI_31759 [Reticulomyxa filosa]|uniref:Dehydrogenase/reductase SDR family member 7 n=1 Tax=Reticulomyxa filosa TaxID=46433 RepID=X6LY26_RETFI|nr:hypothetical protein RFI_31759 [Reticulomyxa filosa]|eukprot:ETO05635.1 hypothetical protein RFI_31759 [Reticulomyxa filosa]
MLFVLSGLVLLVLLFFVDADYTTYILHWYRKKFLKNSFRKKTIWILGASSGIGECLAYELVKDGAHRLILSSRRQEELERVKKNCSVLNSGCDVVIRSLDAIKSINPETVQDNDAIADDLFQRYNDINIVVLNLGGSQRGLAMDTDLSLYKTVFQLNTLSVIELARTFVRAVRKRNKTSHRHLIAVTSSMAGKIGSPGQPAYTTSKHALNGLFDSLRIELAPESFRVSIVCPGPTHVTTSSTQGFGNSPDESSGRLSDDKNSKKKMSTQRCAELYATALYFNLHEAWLCQAPTLIYGYFRQYLPVLFVPLSTMFGQGQLHHYAKKKN